eukprot:433472_1
MDCKMDKISNGHKKIYNPRSCFDSSSDTIYIYDAYGQLFVISTKTKQTIIIPNIIKINYPRVIYTEHNSTLHLIGGADNNIHYIFDSKTNNFIEHHSFTEYESGLAGFGIFYIKQKVSLLLLGGIKWEQSEFSNDIHMYNCNKNQWNKLTNLNVPSAMSRFGYAITRDEEYIFLCGGFEDFDDVDYIYIIKTNIMDKKCQFEIGASEIKCPKESKNFHAITMCNDMEDELIVFGYIRSLWRNDNIFDSVTFPPFYIIKLINDWYCNEYLHILETVNDPVYHWKIHVDKIIESMM